MTWDLPQAAEVALKISQRMLGPQPGEVFIALPLHFTPSQHIYRCAMINLETPEDELQGRILDYILANDKVPLFMLNDVPMYLAGYRKAKSE